MKKFLALLTICVMLVMTLASCGILFPSEQPDGEHEHVFLDGKCECGESDPNYVAPHEHSFVDGKCECGETDPNYVAPHTHTFVEGKCECGVTDPNYAPETEPGEDDPQIPDDPKTPDDNEGLSTGAIVAIVAVAVVALGGGGFVLYWFVFKKKRI